MFKEIVRFRKSLRSNFKFSNELSVARQGAFLFSSYSID
jgi:hypothetical protein